MTQRGKVAVSNRMHGFAIWACSRRFLARIVLQRALLRRGNFFISKSWEGSSRRLQQFWGRLSVYLAERAVWRFSVVAAWRPSKRAKPAAWDPPPGSLIRAYSERFQRAAFRLTTLPRRRVPRILLTAFFGRVH